MQSISSRRFIQVPLATILVVASVSAGIVALNLTDNLPGNADSVALTRPASVVNAPSAGEGLLGPGATLGSSNPLIRSVPPIGAGEGLVGPGATLGSFRPAVTMVPALGADEGLIGPGATLESFRPIVTGSSSHGQGEGLIGPGAVLDAELNAGSDAAPHNGVLTE